MQELVEWLGSEMVAAVIGVAVGLVVNNLALAGIHSWQKRRKIEKAESAADAEQRKQDIADAKLYRRLKEHVEEEKPMWHYRGYRAPAGTAPSKIVSVVNFKGGVGKSTITANLAAYLTTRRDCKVLMVDLDYQASLTDLVLSGDEDLDDHCSLEDLLRVDQVNGARTRRLRDSLLQVPLALPGEETRFVSIIPSNSSLTEVEQNQLLRWLLHLGSDDVRSRMRRILWSDAFSDFDLVLLDSPPRLSLAGLGALVASTHYLVPTRPQFLSTQGAVAAVRQISNLMNEIGAKVEFLGVVPNLTSRSLTLHERGLLSDMVDQLPSSKHETLFESHVPNVPAIANSELGVAYVQRGRTGDSVRDLFDALGAEFSTRLQVP